MLDKKRLTDEEIKTASREVIDLLRKYRPAVFEVKLILREVIRLLDYVVLREKEE